MKCYVTNELKKREGERRRGRADNRERGRGRVEERERGIVRVDDRKT